MTCTRRHVLPPLPSHHYHCSDCAHDAHLVRLLLTPPHAVRVLQVSACAEHDEWGPLHKAAEMGNHKQVAMLLAAGADPLKRTLPTDANTAGRTADMSPLALARCVGERVGVWPIGLESGAGCMREPERVLASLTEPPPLASPPPAPPGCRCCLAACCDCHGVQYTPPCAQVLEIEEDDPADGGGGSRGARRPAGTSARWRRGGDGRGHEQK